MLTLQELIRRLTAFWEKKGCIIHQGHDVEVGAGTFNPATFLRCLGPEPYHTAYVEPSRRPADARFGQNPNRIQLFHQFQVLLKPSPPDIQKNYLQSLKAVGFDLDKHDIRFVHDDWESPTLGAWGLGWEVWCDGMEVSQFTYFQAMASLPLKPFSGEITYGLERLCMFLQNVDNMLDIQWNDKLTLGDISRQNEIEWSTYNFLESSPEMWLKHFADYEKEAKQLVAKNLPIPAYDFVIKASHAFNMLDARGVISTTERTGYIGRIRDLARLVASQYIHSREKQSFPLIKQTPAVKAIKPKKNATAFDAGKKRDFLLEIGSEELPATFVPIGCRNLEKEIRSLLDSRALSYDKIDVFGTPRRLSVLIHNLVEGSPTTTLEKKGPPLSQVLHPDGSWTAQGEGFLKSLSLSKISLEEIRQGKSKELCIKPLKDIDYLFATVTQKGVATSQILAENLPHLITTLEFPKKMSWGNLDITYARPLRWIVALFGESVVSFAVGDIVSSNFSYGHAQRNPVKFRVKNPQEYIKILKDHFVIASIEERKQMILSQLTQIQNQLTANTPQESRVLNEVVHLTEFPELALGHFNPAYLKAPKELLISEMVEHQRYFPLEKNHELMSSFIITCDRTPTELIVQGNQKVLSARLADGLFLFQQDAATPLEELAEKLKTVTFQEKLGTIADKVARMQVCAEMINKALHNLTPEELLKKAVSLCKADLTSGCVKEFPELQGTIGKYITLAQSREKEMALAIEEHWLPKAEGGALPKSPCGIVLSLADKIDNLISYFKVGLKPSSSSDPYALRRQAIGIIRLILDHKYNLHLTPLLIECGSSEEMAREIFEFIKARAKGVFEEPGFLKDEIEASIPEDSNLYDWACRLKALHTVRKTSEFRDFCEMHKRMKGFLSASTNGERETFNETLLHAPEEKALYLKLKAEKPHILKLIQERNYEKAYQELIAFKELLKAFADNVKVHDDNLEIRANRESLLKQVFSLFAGLVELAKLSL